MVFVDNRPRTAEGMDGDGEVDRLIEDVIGLARDRAGRRIQVSPTHV